MQGPTPIHLFQELRIEFVPNPVQQKLFAPGSKLRLATNVRHVIIDIPTEKVWNEESNKSKDIHHFYFEKEVSFLQRCHLSIGCNGELEVVVELHNAWKFGFLKLLRRIIWCFPRLEKVSVRFPEFELEDNLEEVEMGAGFGCVFVDVERTPRRYWDFQKLRDQRGESFLGWNTSSEK